MGSLNYYINYSKYIRIITLANIRGSVSKADKIWLSALSRSGSARLTAISRSFSPADNSSKLVRNGRSSEVKRERKDRDRMADNAAE